ETLATTKINWRNQEHTAALRWVPGQALYHFDGAVKFCLSFILPGRPHGGFAGELLCKHTWAEGLLSELKEARQTEKRAKTVTWPCAEWGFQDSRNRKTKPVMNRTDFLGGCFI